MNTQPSTPPAPVRVRRVFSAFTPREILRRFDRAVFRARLIRHAERWAVVYLLAALAIVWFDAHYTFGLNVTGSLPVRLFLIHRGELPARGDYVAFHWPGGGPYPGGATFIKMIAGVPGDIVSRVDLDYFVNCYPVGRAKPTSRQGVPLEPGPTGTLPEGAYYVRAAHPDSLDSRYRLTGWVTQTQIIGRAYALF